MWFLAPPSPVGWDWLFSFSQYESRSWHFRIARRCIWTLLFYPYHWTLFLAILFPWYFSLIKLCLKLSITFFPFLYISRMSLHAMGITLFHCLLFLQRFAPTCARHFLLCIAHATDVFVACLSFSQWFARHVARHLLKLCLLVVRYAWNATKVGRCT